MAKELEGKVAAVTGGASGIGLASTEAMLAAGARVVLVDRDEAALTALREKHGDAVIPLVIDLLDAKSCATLMPLFSSRDGKDNYYEQLSNHYGQVRRFLPRLLKEIRGFWLGMLRFPKHRRSNGCRTSAKCNSLGICSGLRTGCSR
jgi:NAD(P)-dependent dehydrogenase (short-subunit alcohol dehydrogenase family)